jgi:hypothetical protein
MPPCLWFGAQVLILQSDNTHEFNDHMSSQSPVTGLWNFNGLSAGTTLASSDGTTVLKRGTVPCALPPDPSTGAPVCADVWITGAGGADVPAFAPGKFGQGLNIASGVLNWGECEGHTARMWFC